MLPCCRVPSIWQTFLCRPRLTVLRPLCRYWEAQTIRPRTPPPTMRLVCDCTYYIVVLQSPRVQSARGWTRHVSFRVKITIKDDIICYRRRRVKGLFLYGLKCQPWIWDGMRSDLADCDIEYVKYPGEVTRTCMSVSDLTAWVSEQYLSHGQAYDFVLGHSMGGLVALQLSV